MVYFGEITFGYVFFSASWFDSGYMLLSVNGDSCMHFPLLYVVYSDPAVDSRPDLRGVLSLSLLRARFEE